MGRFFDRLCSIVERQFPSAELTHYLKEAALFDFPQRWHETAKDGEAAKKGGMDDYVVRSSCWTTSSCRSPSWRSRTLRQF